MPERKTEQILQALLAALDAAKPTGAEVWRNRVLPKRLPAAGLIILRDGDPGEPEYLLSPPRWLWEHTAEIDVLVQAKDASRDALFDTLVQAVGAALTADRGLGGLCDWIEGQAPVPTDLAEDGTDTIKAASIAVTLFYDTDSELG